LACVIPARVDGPGGYRVDDSQRGGHFQQEDIGAALQSGLFEHHDRAAVSGGGWKCDCAIWEFQRVWGCRVKRLSRHAAQGPGVCDPE
jgi:hypothetical protein